MPQIPGTGHPDGEARPMPHGAPLAYDTGASAPVGGLSIDNGGSYWPVAAYRSVAIVVQNSGAFPVTVTPEFGFYEGSSLLNTFPVQTVQAGQTKRLLFQCEAELLIEVVIRGVGGTSTVGYYIVGSNLDPFSGAANDVLSLIRRAPNQSIPNNTATFVEYGTDPSTRRYTNNEAAWSYTLTGGGDIQKVHCELPGLYLARAHFNWGAPLGAYNKSLSLACFSSVGEPPLTGVQTDQCFDQNEVSLEASMVFGLGDADVGSGNNNISVSVLQVSGGAVTVDDSLLQIVRLSPVFP